MDFLSDDDKMRLTEAHHAAHLEDIVNELMHAGMEFAWNRGYVSGHSNAMRRMSDEPDVPKTPNPYRSEE